MQITQYVGTVCPTCIRNISYIDQAARDVYVRGIADPEIQATVLGNENQKSEFEVLHTIEAEEEGQRSGRDRVLVLFLKGCLSQYSTRTF